MKKKLFAFDMDGTLLSDSPTTKISQATVDIIKKLKDEGHIVCLFTGRPWRASKKTYDELNLDTLMVNYNGAYIHHPKDYEFLPIVQTISPTSVMKVLNSKEINKVVNNIVVEGPQYIQLMKEDDSHFVEQFIQVRDKSILNIPIQYDKMINDPVGVLMEVKKEYAENIYDVSRYFKSRYGDMGAFYYWDTGKDNNPILEFTSYKAKKSYALIKLARYYGIDMNDTVAFGDGYNDVEMLKISGLGVAMANADDVVKSYANVVSKFTNKDSGVAKFIKWYLKVGHTKLDTTFYQLNNPSKAPKREIKIDQ